MATPWARSSVKSGNVLHLALEDNERRLKERQALLLGSGPKPELVEYNTTWPRIEDGGIEEMEHWADSVPNPRAIFIDIIKMVRRQRRIEQVVIRLRLFHH